MNQHHQYITEIIRKVQRRQNMELRDKEISELQALLDRALEEKEKWRNKYWELKRRELAKVRGK